MKWIKQFLGPIYEGLWLYVVQEDGFSFMQPCSVHAAAAVSCR